MFQETQSSAFWFQPVWGLHSGDQHAVNFLHLVNGFNLCQKNSRICLRILSPVLEEEVEGSDFVLWLGYQHCVFLDCFSLFLNFLTSLIKLFFGTWGRSRRPKFFCEQEAEDTGRDGPVPGKALQSPAQFQDKIWNCCGVHLIFSVNALSLSVVLLNFFSK